MDFKRNTSGRTRKYEYSSLNYCSSSVLKGSQFDLLKSYGAIEWSRKHTKN